MMGKKVEVTQIQIEGISIELRRKKIRSFRISVHSPGGEVRVSAPLWMSDSRILNAILERKDWIIESRKRWEGVAVLLPIEIKDGHLLHFRGEDLTLKVFENAQARSTLQRIGNELHLRAGIASSQVSRQKMVERWYRDQLQSLLPEVLTRWQQKLGVQAGSIQIKKMKSRWGSCHPKSKKITLNVELMRCAPRALDYVVLHELAHLIEPSHNSRFKAILDEHLPGWREIQKALPMNAT